MSSPGRSYADPERAAGRLIVWDVHLDASARVVVHGSRPVEPTSVEFALLELLLPAAGQVVTRKELAKEGLGRRLSVSDRSIDVHLSSLRKKRGHQQGETERIKTVRGGGYVYSRPPGAAEGTTPDPHPRTG